MNFRGFYLVSWPSLLGGAASNKLGIAFYAIILFLVYFIHNKGKLKVGIFWKLYPGFLSNSDFKFTCVHVFIWLFNYASIVGYPAFSILLSIFLFVRYFQKDSNYAPFFLK